MQYLKAVRLLDENGEQYGVRHIDNKPFVSTHPFLCDIVQGNVPGSNVVYKFGSNDSVGTSSETLWTEGGLYDWAAVDAAEGIVKISSTSSDDEFDQFSIGARKVTIYGLDTDGLEQNEQVSLTGQTSVNSTKSYSRVNRIIVNIAGDTGANVGKIYVGTGTVTAGVPAVKWAVVEAGLNQTLMSLWTVPSNKDLYVRKGLITTNGNKGASFNMFVRPAGELFQIKTRGYIFSGSVPLDFPVPLKIEGGSDIDIRAMATATGAGFGAQFLGWTE